MIIRRRFADTANRRILNTDQVNDNKQEFVCSAVLKTPATVDKTEKHM